jgi:polyisoprenoid-binding protein YceI
MLLWCTGTRSSTPAQSWRIDETHTSIGFKIDAVGFPTTRGRFTHYAGRILIDFERPAKSFTSFTVNSASVDLGSQSFNDFVKSPVLLNTERFPTLSFTSTQVEKVDPRIARVTGNLTMLGVTRPITLTVNVEGNPSAKGRAIAFVATGTITRSEFGMMFGIPLVDDALEITVKTRAARFELTQAHKSIGIAVLAITLTRLCLRILASVPKPEPAAPLLLAAAKTAHIALYALLLAMPLSGWLMATTTPVRVPTFVFGLFELPYPLAPALPTYQFAHAVHVASGIALASLIALHFAAALVHALLWRDRTLARMWRNNARQGETLSGHGRHPAVSAARAARFH